MTPENDRDRDVRERNVKDQAPRDQPSRDQAPRDPGDYADMPSRPAAGGGRFDRERLTNDYEEEPIPRRRPAAAGGAMGGGLKNSMSSMLGNDPATRKLVGGAIGIGAVLLLAVGGWSLMGGHQGGIPIIGPPPGPVKDRPADPGGMEIMGGDGAETDMTGNGDAHLAPGPEQPDTKGLAQQYGVPPGTPAPDAGRSPASPAPENGQPVPPPSGTPSQTPVAPAVPSSEDKAAPEAAQPVPEAPKPVETPAPAKEKPKDAAPARPPHHAVERPLPPPVPAPENGGPAEKPATGGSREVQLGALDSEAAARKEWDSLRHQAPALFAGHTPLFEKTTHADHTFVRLRIGGFADLKTARAYCVKLHAQSIACTPAQF
ncbi:SPOR domain-containing protein [Gluconobacter morbifer]|uniref:SPOR domain-containing protein n=1 Tax=Gluconobacter morbifer G707 TaxID=1088869 RepID=G6XG39_9PROT|nr:SPOR domain-containing protein [Gluconobacter morbifer]EHH69147.1 hypothetical protein GMO_04540 [Gluconobacter morbifer G707]